MQAPQQSAITPVQREQHVCKAVGLFMGIAPGVWHVWLCKLGLKLLCERALGVGDALGVLQPFARLLDHSLCLRDARALVLQRLLARLAGITQRLDLQGTISIKGYKEMEYGMLYVVQHT